MAVDRAALRAWAVGTGKPGGYGVTVRDQVEGWRRELLAECRARGVQVHLTGTTDPPAHGPVDTPLLDVAAQLSERWPDPGRTDGRAWTLTEAVRQVELCCRALDAADRTPKTPATPKTGGGAATPAPPPPARFVPDGIAVTWAAELDGARDRMAAGYQNADWESEPKGVKGVRVPAPIADPTRAGRDTVLSAAIPTGLSAKGRSEVLPKTPSARAGQTVAFGFDLHVRSISPGGGPWGGDVIAQYAQGGYTPALELKLGGGRLFLDGNSGSWHHDLGPCPTGRWVTVTVRADMAVAVKGARIDAWLDRRSVVVDARPVGAGTLYGAAHRPYAKHGLYAAPGRGGEVLFDHVWWGTAT